MGGATYGLRPLTMAAAETWETRIRSLIGSALNGLGEQGAGVDAVLAIGHAAVSAQLDALYAYDELGAVAEGLPSNLPERQYLFSHASRDDLATALRKLVEHEFPLLRSASLLTNWVPPEVRQILGRHLVRILVDEPQSEPSSSSSSTSIRPTAIPKRRARR